jgi:hypothetical protein
MSVDQRLAVLGPFDGQRSKALLSGYGWLRWRPSSFKRSGMAGSCSRTLSRVACLVASGKATRIVTLRLCREGAGS